MDSIKCEIVRDLLPSYMDEVISENTASVMEGHLSGCSSCRKYYEGLKLKRQQDELENIRRDKNFHDKLLKYHDYAIGFLIGLLIPVGAVIAWLMIVFM